MTASRVISIVPSLPPMAGGVGDYALRLACQMRADSGVETLFIVASPAQQDMEHLEGFKVIGLPENSSQELARILGELNNEFSMTVLIHLSGYGYAKWSLYRWLVDGLNHWQQQTPNGALLTMFHELVNPPSWPWKHNFWVYLSQKKLFEEMAGLSDRCFTNCHIHQAQLLRLSSHQDVPLMPVFSNIGEPQQSPPLSSRKRQLVVFGQQASRVKVYQESAKEMAAFCEQLSLERIVDIGSLTGLDLEQYFDIPVEQLGRLSAEAVSEVMLDSIAGWSSYPENYLEKSSIFSAYCAHGVVTVLNMANPQKPRADFGASPPYLASYQFMNSHGGEVSMELLQGISTLAYDWYQGHTLREQAQVFAEAIAEASKKRSANAVLFPSL